jgi:hypothetical protein
MNNKNENLSSLPGFFLSGTMAMYALSTTVLIFRETEFLKSEKEIERQLPANLSED